MSYKDKILVFWGAMDTLALVSYFVFSLKMGHVPFWSDIQLFYANLTLMDVRGMDLLFLQSLFFIYLGLMFSLFISAYIFLRRAKISLLFIGLQEMMRILSLTCSVAIFPLILHAMRIDDARVGIVLFAISETLKVGSLFWLRKRRVLTQN